ncbi:glycosyltransferase family 2 protein [Mucilaginibacter flavus]|uniref:glycosyltransferase family 2 protein n=1 Tax=Mucilaginibacter flavus TaxID=931504 RepID=UPI0025B2A46B|nr:glycosyltransferase family 2 protein [Mucilaginibacter flavus]MDN3582819.1 glycosyltransferase family 2 protein [Mucilaginibacter flavus]
MKLTIAIPTYNRPDKVLNTVKTLLSLINDETCILVLDNCSDVVIKDYIYENVDVPNTGQLRVQRNFINLGADGNFMRCFEYCKTPYIWILADDGIVEPEAIERIFLELENNAGDDVVGFNFGSNYTSRTETTVAVGMGDFLSKIDNFENFLFLSTSVYKCDEYIKNIRYGYWGAYTMASQNIPCLVGLSNGKKLIISKYKIVINILDDRTEKWPDAQQALGLSALLEAPLNLTGLEYEKFGKFLFASIETFPRILCDIILGVKFNVDKIDDYHIYLYKKIYKTSFQFRRNKPKQYLAYKACYLLLVCKPLLKLVLKSEAIRKSVLTSSKFNIFVR